MKYDKIKFMILLFIIWFAIDLYSMKYEKSSEISFNFYIARLLRASLRFPPGVVSKHISCSDCEGTEDVINEMIKKKIWQNFSYNQKKEFTLLYLIYCKDEGGGLTLFLIMTGKDSTRVINDIGKISNKILIDKFELNTDGIKNYRNRLQMLK